MPPTRVARDEVDLDEVRDTLAGSKAEDEEERPVG